MVAALASGTATLLAGCNTDSERATSTRTGSPPTETTTPESDLSIDLPESASQDQPVDVALTGAVPGSTVTLEASMDSGNGVTWSSSTTWSADEQGVVDLAERAPDDGPYDEADAMGWLWSTTPEDDSRPFAHQPGTDSKTVTLRAADDTTALERAFELQLNDPDLDRSVVSTDGVAGVLYEPSGEGPHPGLIALHGSSGRLPRRRAQLLATHGYATLALRYFGEPEQVPDELECVPLAYFERSQRWLRGLDAVRDAPVGVVGVSRGGELALLLSARFDWPGAVVSYVGSGAGIEGIVYGDTVPAWTHDGDPVPYATYTEMESGDVADAAFAVENANAPILLISAGDDGVWPSKRLSQVAVDRLDAHGFEYEYQHATYEDAGHLVTAPYVPTANRQSFDGLVYGGTAAGYARANADSWPKVLSYLEKGLEG